MIAPAGASPAIGPLGQVAGVRAGYEAFEIGAARTSRSLRVSRK